MRFARDPKSSHYLGASTPPWSPSKAPARLDRLQRGANSKHLTRLGIYGVLCLLGFMVAPGCFHHVVPASFDQIREASSTDSDGTLWYYGRGSQYDGLRIGMQPSPIRTLESQGYRFSRLILTVKIKNPTSATLVLDPTQFSIPDSSNSNSPKCTELNTPVSRMIVQPNENREFQLHFEVEGSTLIEKIANIAWCYELDGNLYHRTSAIPLLR